MIERPLTSARVRCDLPNLVTPAVGRRLRRKVDWKPARVAKPFARSGTSWWRLASSLAWRLICWPLKKEGQTNSSRLSAAGGAIERRLRRVCTLTALRCEHDAHRRRDPSSRCFPERTVAFTAFRGSNPHYYPHPKGLLVGPHACGCAISARK
jgi:hypothetical protein